MRGALQETNLVRPPLVRFPFVRPDVPRPAAWVPHLEAAYEAKYFTNFGPVEQRLSRDIAGRYLPPGSVCVLCANATVGLSAALVAQEIRGNVAIPAFTFPATLHAVYAARCNPVLCDVDAETWELSATALRSLMDKMDIAAVVPVRVFGFVRNQYELRKLAWENGIPVIADAAAALGQTVFQTGLAEHENDIEVFSLHATKSFGIGEGGAIFAAERHKEALRRALNFGLRPDRSFGYGFNGKMSEIQAAVGLAVLETVERQINGRREMATFYDSLLHHRRVVFPAETGETPWTNYPVLLPSPELCEAVAARALDFGLQLRRYYSPSLSVGYCDPCENPLGTPISEDLSGRMVCLPLYPDAIPAELDEIAAVLSTVLDEYGV